MRLLPMLLGTALCFATTNALNAGLQLFDIPADAAGGQLSGGVWYPCNAPRQETIVQRPSDHGNQRLLSLRR